MYALSTEGGIYLDSDVEVIKSYNDLLSLPYFICEENSPEGIEAATIGVDLDCEWIKRCFEQYERRAFIDEDGRMDTKVLPVVLESIIRKNYELVKVEKPSSIVIDNKRVFMLPYDYFSPKNYTTKKIKLTEHTYSIHHFAGSWQPAWKKVLLYFWVPFKTMFPSLAKAIHSL